MYSEIKFEWIQVPKGFNLDGSAAKHSYELVPFVGYEVRVYWVSYKGISGYMHNLNDKYFYDDPYAAREDAVKELCGLLEGEHIDSERAKETKDSLTEFRDKYILSAKLGSRLKDTELMGIELRR